MNNDQHSDISNQNSQAMLNTIILDYLRENKWKRRWRWVLRSIFLFIILMIGYQIATIDDDGKGSNTKPHVGLIDINGEIGDGKEVNSDDFAKGMDVAYKNPGLKAVILRINSPGGSPVQAEYMYNTIKYYSEKYPDIKIYSVCVDMCASAAYYIAAGTDKIYASPASMVGSIGVVFSSFGFVDMIQKLGVTRRMQTAGKNKGFYDPFSPVNEDQKHELQVMLDQVHQQFINRVKEGRGDRLHIDDNTFSGMIWTGEQSLTMGLIDGIASSGQLSRDVIKINSIIDYTKKSSFLDRVTKNIGTAMANELPMSLGLNPHLS